MNNVIEKAFCFGANRQAEPNRQARNRPRSDDGARILFLGPSRQPCWFNIPERPLSETSREAQRHSFDTAPFHAKDGYPTESRPTDGRPTDGRPADGLVGPPRRHRAARPLPNSPPRKRKGFAAKSCALSKATKLTERCGCPKAAA